MDLSVNFWKPLNYLIKTFLIVVAKYFLIKVQRYTVEFEKEKVGLAGICSRNTGSFDRKVSKILNAR